MLYIALVHVVKTRYRFADVFSASSAAKIPPGESLPVHMNYLMKWTQVEIYIVRDRARILGIPHRGDLRLFWDRDSWRALCKRCHDQKTGREDSNPVYRY